MEAQEQLSVERCCAERRREELEAAFQERLAREVSQKEQELLEEVAYLKRTNDSKERRLQELRVERSQLERRAQEEAARATERESAMEAHAAIAKAFGDAGAEIPAWLQLLDEPMLKFNAALLQRPLFRRVFFFSSGLLWFYTLHHSIAPGGGGHI